MNTKQLQISQADQMVAVGIGRAREAAMPRGGWLRTARMTLGMSMRDLANRVGIAMTGIAAAERGEQSGSITLKQLRRIANAMDCELVYGLVPRGSFRQIIERRAEDLARKQVGRVSHSMALEEQKTAPAFERKLTRDLKLQLMTSPARLWRSK